MLLIKPLPFSSVPDRGLFLLQSHGITYSFNEMVGIQTHDGLYDPANDKYLKAYMPEQNQELHYLSFYTKPI